MGRFELKDTEKQVAEQLINGWADADIASFLEVHVGTVKQHLQEMYERFDVPCESAKRVQLAIYLHAHKQQFGLVCWDCQ